MASLVIALQSQDPGLEWGSSAWSCTAAPAQGGSTNSKSVQGDSTNSKSAQGDSTKSKSAQGDSTNMKMILNPTKEIQNLLKDDFKSNPSVSGTVPPATEGQILEPLPARNMKNTL